MKHLVIIGVGGFAREVYWHAQDSRGFGREWDLKGFLDGDVRLDEAEYKKLELPILGDVNSYEIQEDDVFICAIAEPNVKQRLVNIIRHKHGKFINLIHNTDIIHGNVVMGTGNILCPWVSLHDHVCMGNFVTLNGDTGMGHDSCIGDYSSLMGKVSINGYVRIGTRVYFGNNACTLPHSIVEDDAYVGIASVVFKRVKSGQKVFGNPAMPI